MRGSSPAGVIAEFTVLCKMRSINRSPWRSFFFLVSLRSPFFGASRISRCSTMVVQIPCKNKVGGSSPSIGSRSF